MDRVLAGERLPSADSDINEARLDFERVCPPTDALRGQNRRSGPAERIQHDVATSGAVFDRIADKADGLDGRMGLEVIHSSGPKRVDARVLPDIRTVPAMAAELDVVEMSRVADPEDAYKLVLAPIERALTGVRLDPDGKIEGFAIDRAAGIEQLANVPPVHAHEMHCARCAKPRQRPQERP
jgi:hypothetical protein